MIARLDDRNSSRLHDKRRILVVGPSGAGKSTLSAALGRALNLPVVHLDQHYWLSGWKEPSVAAWDVKLAELLDGPAWIMDGNYDRTLPTRLKRADAVLFLDLPPPPCRRGILKRILSTWGRVRPDMAEGCPEKWDWEFIRWAWAWHRDIRPAVVDALDRVPPKAEVVRLRSRREVADLLAVNRVSRGTD